VFVWASMPDLWCFMLGKLMAIFSRCLDGQINGKDMGTTNTYFHIGQHQFEGLPSRASGRPRPCTAATERAV